MIPWKGMKMSKMNVRTVLKRVDSAAIRALIKARAPDLANEIDWSTEGDVLHDAIEKRLDRGGEDGGDVRAILIQIGRFFDENWRAALRSVIAERPDLLEAFDAASDTGAAAIAILVEDSEAFQRAVASAEVDRYIGGQSWGGYVVRGSYSKRPEIEGTARHVFQVAVQSIVKSVGPELSSQVDWFTRTVRDPQTGGEHQIVQATIYAEQPPEAVLRFRGARLQRHLDKDVSEAAVLWDPQAGTLDVKILGGKKVREQLAETFAGSVLGRAVKVEPIERRQVHLDILKRPGALELRPDDLVEAVRVVMIVMHDSSDDGGLLTLKAERSAGKGEVYRSAPRWFVERSPFDRPDVRVFSAVLRFMLPGSKPDRPRAVTVKLTRPNTTNLHSLTDEDRRVITALLDRWQLLEATLAADEEPLELIESGE